MLKEFKEFIMRGNVLDLAVAVIIGAAFGAIVTSLVEDVLMPPIGAAAGRVDFSNLYIPLAGQAMGLALAEARKAGAVIAYGKFLNALINFLIVAFCVFLIVKQVNRFKKPVPVDSAPSTKECPFCASSIAAKAVRCPNCTSQLTSAPAVT